MSTNEVTPTPQPKLTLADRPDLQEIVADIMALKALGRGSLFLTHKSQREILNKLNPYDLCLVARAAAEAEKRRQPIYTKPASK
jgi:hypothetical protein